MANDSESFYRQLGQRIARARKSKAGLTQEKLAGALGLSRPSMVNIEHGRHPLQVHQLVVLAQVLGLTVLDLLPAKNETADVLAIRSKLAGFDQQSRNWVEKVISNTAATTENTKDEPTASTSPTESARPPHEGTDQGRARARRRSRP